MKIFSSTAYLLFKVVVVGSSKCLMYTEIMCTCNFDVINVKLLYHFKYSICIHLAKGY